MHTLSGLTDKYQFIKWDYSHLPIKITPVFADQFPLEVEHMASGSVRSSAYDFYLIKDNYVPPSSAQHLKAGN